MSPALIITIVLLLIASVVIYVLVEERVNNLRLENKFLIFQKKVFFNIAQGLNDSENFEDAVNILVSTISEYFDFTVCSFLIKTPKQVKFKAYLNTPVNYSYIKILERKSLEYFSKKSNLSNLSSLEFTENISGFGVNNEIDLHPNSIAFVPINFKNNCIGVFVISSVNNKYCINKVCDRLKISIKEIFTYIFEIQELGKTGTAKEEYMNMIIHDLRTPLTIIQGSCDMLIKRKKQLSEKMQEELLVDTKSAAKRLLNIVDNLLDIARLENGKFKVDIKKVEMVDFLKSIVNQYKIFVEEHGLKYIVKLPTDKNIICEADTHILERVFDNLISNAVKYTKTGSVTVMVEKLKNKNKIKVSVTDTGLGINKDKQKLLFNKFEQIVNPVDATSKSTGLGLVVAKKLIEANNGKMDFVSTENVGSTFYFVLPTVK